jgi:hypothetical protein
MSFCLPLLRLSTVTAVALLVIHSELAAQRVPDDCFRFDRKYFSWVGRPPDGGAVFADSSAVVRFSWTTHPSIVGSRVLTVPAMLVDSAAANSWLRASRWRVFAKDSVEVSWYNNLYGTAFRLGGRGDTLVGRVRFLTDNGPEPPSQRATAVRIPCP